nr:MAG TPA: hypothetical protein [Caudoviricetes sp.]
MLLLALFCCRWHAINSHNKLGGAYCIYNNDIVFAHLTLAIPDGLANGTLLATFPNGVNLKTLLGIGANSVTGAVGVSSNGYNIVCNGFVSAGNYIADLMFIRA